MTNINTKINTILEQVGHEHVKINLKNVILGFDYDTVQNVHIRIYLNTVLQMVKWEVWKVRKIVRYENKIFSTASLLKYIMSKIDCCAKFMQKTKTADKFKKILDLLRQFDNHT